MKGIYLVILVGVILLLITRSEHNLNPVNPYANAQQRAFDSFDYIEKSELSIIDSEEFCFTVRNNYWKSGCNHHLSLVILPAEADEVDKEKNHEKLD